MNLLVKYILTALALLTVLQSNAQYPIVTIVEEKINGIGPCEPTIFINPKSPNNMVVSLVNDKTMTTTGTKTYQNKVYVSKDFGESYKGRFISSRYGDFGDPCIIADNEGYFYYFHLSDPEKLGWDGKMVMDRIICQRSKNGKSWNRGVSIGHQPNKQHEKPWGTFDETSGRVYVTWTQYDKFGSTDPLDSAHIMLSYSDDRGLSWLPAIRINQIGGDCSGGNATPTGAIPVAGPEQEMYVSWANSGNIYFDRSEDGGVTWLKQDKVVAEQVGGWQLHVPGFGLTSGTPVIGCDISYGAHHGTIYICWADQKNGKDDSDIWISKSTDNGENWSEPKRVNNDKVELIGKHQCFNWLAVDPITGHVHVLFYDRRNYSDNKTDVYMATSSDGGETFVNEKISSEPFEPDPDVYMGNYISITAYGGFVRPIWTTKSDDKLKILSAIIDAK